MNPTPLITSLNEIFTLQLPPALTETELETRLAEAVNHLMEKDFNRLITILYRVDVDEQQLKQLLKENAGTNAGLIIARLMIERQRRKIITRESFKNTETNGDAEW
jgi:hypothetical protein